MSSPLLVVAFYESVIAVDQKTGETVWETPTGGGRAQVLQYKDRVYVASERGGLLVLRAEDGSTLHTTPLSGRGQAPTLLIDKETVFVMSGGELQAFTLDGTLLWINPFKGKGNGAASMATEHIDRQADEY